MKPEHPRALSTDDVGFFSLVHGMLGPVFDLKQFYDKSRKLLNIQEESIRNYHSLTGQAKMRGTEISNFLVSIGQAEMALSRG